MNALLAAALAAQLASGEPAPAQDPPRQDPAAQDASDAPDQTIIVTGTRFSGLRAKDSPEPVQVVTSDALKTAGPPNLSEALSTLVPSFNTQAVGNDLANETLAARLRGVSPNHTLVLVNGKRLHGTANLSVLASAFQGGAAPDLNFIPVASIKRVEVLLDGAAAQYGSDAIAGVINIILNDTNTGGWGEAYAGQYIKGDGETTGGSGNLGIALGGQGFLNVSAETRFHGYSNAGGPDARVERAIASGEHPEWVNLDDYPLVNKVFGDARYVQRTLAANMKYELGGGAEAYAFGSYGHRNAGGFANFRLPSRLPQLYPNGFNPVDRVKSSDYSGTIGASGELAGWGWDLSTTYGRNDNRVEVTDSANIDLFNDTGSTPTDFYNGGFNASEWTTNLDVRRQLSGTVGLAMGAEHRRGSYALLPGDEASRYKAGSQSFPGFALTDAGRHSRTNEAAYLDVNLAPGGGVTVDLAGRFEHYSDFGSTVIGKVSARKELTDRLALRGTASTGFRAPTLAESYYSATNVQPNSAFVQLPPNAPAAALIGIKPLAPERSRNFSLGAVASTARGLSVTVDVYQIAISDRIVGSGTLYGTFAGELRSEAVNQAITANGNVLENVPFTGVNLFTNGLDTRTRGVDVVGNFRTGLGGFGSIQWSLSGSYGRTKVTRIRDTPVQISASGQKLFDPVAISTLETASPRFKAVLSGLYRSGGWTISAKERFFGNASNFQDPGDGRYYRDSTGAAFITDLDVTRTLLKKLSISAGAINLFNKRPDRVNAEALAVAGAAGSPAVEIYPKFSAFGINGGYYYVQARLGFH